MRASRNQEQPQEGERLHKVLAHAGVASRRKCEELISAGRVQVNGEIVTELGTRIRPKLDQVAVDGEPVELSGERFYYKLYKPVGYLSTVRDPFGRRTALQLVPAQKPSDPDVKLRLFPVGRLDLNSEGLLLFTNDGELAQRLIHPRYEHDKEYLVLVQGQVTPDDVAQMKRGMHLYGQQMVCEEVEPLPPDWSWRGLKAAEEGQWVRVILKEGHKRQLRYMFEAVDCKVIRLIRVRIGDIRLGKLQAGEGQWLSPQEVSALRAFVGLDRPSDPKKTARPRGRSIDENNNRHRRPGGVGQEHRRRRARP